MEGTIGLLYIENSKYGSSEGLLIDWLQVGQVAQELGRMWKALSDAERADYERRAHDDKERYAQVR